MNRRPLGRISLIAVLFGLLFAGAGACIADTGDHQFEFKIKAGKAVKSLKAFSYQADIEIMFAKNLARNVKTRAIEGRLTIEEALRQMLEDTPLVAVPVSAGEAYAIKQKATDPGGNQDRPETELNNQSDLHNQAMNLPESERSATLRKALSGLIAALTASAATSVVAQNENDDGDVYELSPFMVDASEDTGYRATETLAGTRIKSLLKDIGTSVSVFTGEFIEDVAANNASDLLVYSPNTEVGGINGNYSAGVQAGESFNFQANEQINSPTRLRGLAEADNTRNYFLTDVPFDTYNVERVDVNRGSNSFLFGLGSPAGIVNHTTKRAFMEDQNEIELEVDDEGSLRVVGDFNRELIDGKLALRAIYLNESRRFRQKQAFDDQERIFITATGKPLENTTIRANFEYGNIDASPPWVGPPVDSLTTWWGPYVQMKTHDPSTVDLREGRQTPRTDIDSAKPRALIVLSNNNDSPAAWFENHDASASTKSAFTGLRNASRGGFPVVNPNAELPERRDAFFYRYLSPWNNVRLERILLANPIGDFLARTQILDRSIYDYQENQLSGGNNRDDGDFRQYTLTLEQLFNEGKLGFEIAFDRNETDTFEYDFISGREMRLDINTKDFFGNPNPNFGRPVAGASPPTVGFGYSENQTFRATGFYRHDWRDMLSDSWGDILGRFDLTGVFTKFDTEAWNYGGQAAVMGKEFRELNFLPSTVNRFNSVGVVNYLGPASLNMTEMSGPQGADIQPIAAARSLPSQLNGLAAWDFANQEWVTRDFDIETFEEDARIPLKTRGSNAAYTENEVESVSFTLQNYLLSENLVATLGWRSDQVDNLTNNPFRNARDELQLFEVLEDPRNQNLGRISGIDISEDTFSWGLVGHLPERWNENLPLGADLSVHYSESENFRVTQGRRSILNESLPPAGGDTKEVGFTLRMFDGKLTGRFNWFETNQTNETDAQMSTVIGGILNVYRTTMVSIPEDQLEAADFILPPQEFLDATNFEAKSVENGHIVSFNDSGVVETVDNVSEGFELDLTYNPTSNWRFMLNVSRQEAALGERGPNLSPLVDFLESEVFVPGTPRGELMGPTATDDFARKGQKDVLRPFKSRVVQSNRPVQELREWRANAVTNYSFQEGILKGFNVGGSARWQEAATIGFPLLDDPELGLIPDLDNPFEDGETFHVGVWLGYRRQIFEDKVDWRVRLNVKNALDDHTLVPVFAQPDGTTQNIFRVGEGRRFILTNTFRF